MSGRRQADDTCPACGLPVLVQWVGDVAAIKAHVTLPPPETRLPYPQAADDRTANNLVWCLPRQRFRPLRLRWTDSRHPPDCPHQHLTTHKCPTQPLF